MQTRLMVTLAASGPGAPLDAAIALADALDARRVPLTLLVGPRPHPEVAAWAAARRRVGDAALLHGTRTASLPGRPYRRLPAHEAGLRLAGALRTRDALGPAVDGFAAPGWALSGGARAALAAAGLDLCVDDAGVHRLGADGTPAASRRGPVTDPEGPRRRARPLVASTLVHLALTPSTPLGVAGGSVDRALDAGATPGPVRELLVPARASVTARRARATDDPEHWSITA